MKQLAEQLDEALADAGSYTLATVVIGFGPLPVSYDRDGIARPSVQPVHELAQERIGWDQEGAGRFRVRFGDAGALRLRRVLARLDEAGVVGTLELAGVTRGGAHEQPPPSRPRDYAGVGVGVPMTIRPDGGDAPLIG